ncbi:spore coat protein [Metabacillus fastidiosus]|uniref:Spore coat protein n=1 Tax=Metabacillus fastidiosus TaxID=1458 RepID=A0ABU6P1J5_9BACI|nr:spore coat protein [Metabacillus fastidiosus]MED4403235.1 spore coat protein [Metabacillus fastidiosus]MED4455470.1 spore coat protein [Metabacillus fastidiosus]MED4461659.1 spore coat protein [Metabacillus fastidiosus]
MEAKRYNWCALEDHSDKHPVKDKCCDDHNHRGDRFKPGFFDGDAVFNQDGVNVSEIDQLNKELIFIKDSCDIKVDSEQSNFAATIQVGVNLIVYVLSIFISVDDAELVTQELLNAAKTSQTNKQKVVIINCKNIHVKAEDSNTAFTLQVIANIFIAILTLIVEIDL